MNVEVVERSRSSEIVRMLGRGMNDEIDRLLMQQALHAGPVPDVEGDVDKTRAVLLEPPEVPAGISIRTEELHAHVVVDADYAPADAVEKANGFRSDEPRGPGHEQRRALAVAHASVPQEESVGEQVFARFGEPRSDIASPAILLAPKRLCLL